MRVAFDVDLHVDLDVEAGVLTTWACVSLLKFSFESTCTERHRIKFRLADTNKSNNRTAKMAPIERDIIAIFKNLFSTGFYFKTPKILDFLKILGFNVAVLAFVCVKFGFCLRDRCDRRPLTGHPPSQQVLPWLSQVNIHTKYIPL